VVAEGSRRAFKAAFDRSLEGRNVDRRGWRILAALARRPTRRSELFASLATFDSPAAIEEALSGLIATGGLTCRPDCCDSPGTANASMLT
jgi:hypothetical protein